LVYALHMLSVVFGATLTHTTDLHHIYPGLTTRRLFAQGGFTHRCGVSWIAWVGVVCTDRNYVVVHAGLPLLIHDAVFVWLCTSLVSASRLPTFSQPALAVPALLLCLLLPLCFSYYISSERRFDSHDKMLSCVSYRLLKSLGAWTMPAFILYESCPCH